MRHARVRLYRTILAAISYITMILYYSVTRRNPAGLPAAPLVGVNSSCRWLFFRLENNNTYFIFLRDRVQPNVNDCRTAPPPQRPLVRHDQIRIGTYACILHPRDREFFVRLHTARVNLPLEIPNHNTVIVVIT